MATSPRAAVTATVRVEHRRGGRCCGVHTVAPGGTSRGCRAFQKYPDAPNVREHEEDHQRPTQPAETGAGSRGRPRVDAGGLQRRRSGTGCERGAGLRRRRRVGTGAVPPRRRSARRGGRAAVPPVVGTPTIVVGSAGRYTGPRPGSPVVGGSGRVVAGRRGHAEHLRRVERRQREHVARDARGCDRRRPGRARRAR